MKLIVLGVFFVGALSGPLIGITSTGSILADIATGGLLALLFGWIVFLLLYAFR